MFTARRSSQLTAAIAVVVAMLLLAACDWTQFRYGPEHTGFNPSETTIGPANVSRVRLRWSQSVGVQGMHHPTVVANGVVYALGNDSQEAFDRLFAFDANTGGARWSSREIGVGRFAPSLANGAVYVTTDTGLYALDATTGAKLWSSTPEGSSPTVANGVVYVSTLSGFDTLPGVDALDATTGAKLWSSTSGGGTPTVANGVVYVSSVSEFDALDATTGAKLWTKVLSDYSFENVPAVANGVVYVCSYDGLHALKSTTGAELWSAPRCNSSPAVANGIVFVGGGELDAYNATTGAKLWSSTLNSSFGAPTVANGVVYGGNYPLSAYDAVTGAQLWSTPTNGDPEPVIANGVVYMSGIDLQAFSLPVTTPLLSISPAFDRDFVYGDPGSEPRIYTITNIGAAPTSVVADSLSGPDAAHFRLTSDGCVGASLAGGASCTVTASYAPTSAGSRTAWLSANATNGGTTRALLAGTAPVLTISPTSSAFPDTFAGMTSATARFQVTNFSDGPVGPMANAVPPNRFTVAADGCAGKTIAAKKSCTIAVNFAPNYSGLYDGPLVVADAAGHHAETYLTGRGLARIELAPSSHDFGSVPVGTTASVTFTVTNISPISAGPIADGFEPIWFLWGWGPFDWYTTTSDSCAGRTLAANASCTFAVRIAPTGPTPFEQATVTVNAPLAGTATAAVTGVGS